MWTKGVIIVLPVLYMGLMLVSYTSIIIFDSIDIIHVSVLYVGSGNGYFTGIML